MFQDCILDSTISAYNIYYKLRRVLFFLDRFRAFSFRFICYANSTSNQNSVLDLGSSFEAFTNFFFIPYCHIVFLQIERGAFFCSQLVPEEGGEAERLFSGK